MMSSIIYWVSTSLLAAFLLISSYTYFMSADTISGLKELGFPDFFRIQLGILKVIAAVVLIVPALPIYVKEWAYAGVGLFFITALVAHVAHRDSLGITILLLVLCVILIISRYYLTP